MRFYLISFLLLLFLLGCSDAAQKTAAYQTPVGLSFGESCENVRLYPEIGHVLDPLNPDEIKLSVDVLRQAGLVGGDWYIQTLSTQEPDKTPDGMYPKVTDTPRKAFVVVLNMRSTEKFECVIDIKQKHLESKTAISKGQPASLFVEQIESKKMIAADPRVIKGLLDRGLDPKNLYVEPWAAGDLSQEDLDKTHRFIRGSLYYREKFN